MSTPRVWPQLVVEEGPRAAGFGVGDALAFPPLAAVSILAVALGAARRALRIGVERAPSEFPAHRATDDAPRLQQSSRAEPWDLARELFSFEGGRVVIERPDGEIVYRAEPRVAGPTLARLRALLPFGQALPREIEALCHGDLHAVVGFDGRVRVSGQDDTRADADVDVAAVARALDPEGAARDAALVEECGVLAG